MIGSRSINFVTATVDVPPNCFGDVAGILWSPINKIATFRRVAWTTQDSFLVALAPLFVGPAILCRELYRLANVLIWVCHGMAFVLRYVHCCKVNNEWQQLGFPHVCELLDHALVKDTCETVTDSTQLGITLSVILVVVADNSRENT